MVDVVAVVLVVGVDVAVVLVVMVAGLPVIMLPRKLRGMICIALANRGDKRGTCSTSRDRRGVCPPATLGVVTNCSRFATKCVRLALFTVTLNSPQQLAACCPPDIHPTSEQLKIF